MIRKINQRTIPKTHYVNYTITNPLNLIRFRNKTLSKGHEILLFNKSNLERRKKRKEGLNTLQEMKIFYSNNNSTLTKINHANYKIFTFHQQQQIQRQDNKIKEENFKEKIYEFAKNVEFKPVIDHLEIVKIKKLNTTHFQATIPRSNSVSKQIQTKLKIPYIYNKIQNKSSNSINTINNSQNSKNDDDDVYANRYDKTKINLDTILLNYNANAKRSFSCEKIKPYQMKISPFAKQHKFVLAVHN